jgi:CBS-domain-containing membrane protein
MSHALPTFRFPPHACIPQAQPNDMRPVTMKAMALEVMTDLTKLRASTIAPNENIADAEHEMMHQGVRLLFVVTELPCVEGIVTLADFYGDKPMRIIATRSLGHASRADIQVRDVMTPIESIEAVDFLQLCKASVGDVVETLRKFGRQHLLVIESATTDTPARIRGLISQTQVEKQLGRSIVTVEVARDFTEIEAALH